MDSYEFKQKLTVKKQYDVIVAGGGVAGVAAAVTAAKGGASVLLLEKSNILGGLGTLGLIHFFVPMDNGNGKQIIWGLAEELLRKSTELSVNTIAPEWLNGEPEQPTHVRYTERYSPYIFALQLLDEIRKAGVDLLYDCIASFPVMEGNTCTGVITDSKSGLELYGCRMLVDTTGDADLLRRSGMPTVAGENYYTYTAAMISLAGCRKAAESGNLRDVYSGFGGGGINLFGDGQPEDMPLWSGLTVEEVTDYLVRNQITMYDRFRTLNKDENEIVRMSLMPNFRTTCHIKGDYSLSVADCYRHFEDSVCAINDFEHRNHLFEVPYRTLTRRGYPNMITAGRSADGTGYGWDLLRVIPPAILTGQAAGEACVLAFDSRKDLNTLDIRSLQQRLEAQNMMIHFPDEYVPEDRTVVIHGIDQSGHAESHI